MQTCPHAPQLASSEAVFTHPPPQHVSSAWQAMQAPPSWPQNALPVPGLHRSPSQHPLAQLSGVQVQAPPTHTWFAAQARPHAPQLASSLPVSTQSPLQQVSPGSQMAQVSPLRPQRVSWVPGSQVFPEQQPFGQLSGLQVHVPATHSWFAAHAWPHAPQFPCSLDVSTQAAAQQVSAFGGQLRHALPPLPHAVLAVPGWQVSPSQHPSAQLAAVHRHAPSTQAVPAGQAAHAAPWTPHCAGFVPARQVAPSQQPLQRLPSQVQTPPMQDWPATQAFWQRPQFVMSLWVSLQVLPQRVLPPEHFFFLGRFRFSALGWSRSDSCRCPRRRWWARFGFASAASSSGSSGTRTPLRSPASVPRRDSARAR